LDGAVVQVNGVKAFGWFALGSIDFRLFKSRRDCRDYAGSNLVLQLKDVIQRSVEPVSSQMCSGRGIDKLAGDTDLAASLSDAAFEYVADAQLSSDLFDIDSFALVGEA